MQDTFDPILSEEAVSKWLDTSRPTLQRQRSGGSGPPFIQLSERRIGYRKSAVEQWLQARTIDRVGALTSRTQASEKPPAFPAAALDNAKPVARNAPASGKRNKELEHD
jgi:predicted DNA-binding transcriptional regulator AlpA